MPCSFRLSQTEKRCALLVLVLGLLPDSFPAFNLPFSSSFSLCDPHLRLFPIVEYEAFLRVLRLWQQVGGLGLDVNCSA